MMAMVVFGAKMACLGYYQEAREHRDKCVAKCIQMFSLSKLP